MFFHAKTQQSSPTRRNALLWKRFLQFILLLETSSVFNGNVNTTLMTKLLNHLGITSIVSNYWVEQTYHNNLISPHSTSSSFGLPLRGLPEGNPLIDLAKLLGPDALAAANLPKEKNA